MITITAERTQTGHYTDAGLGGELVWREPETTLWTSDGEALHLAGAQDSQRVVWKLFPGAAGMDLTRHTPWFATHDELVAFWRTRFVEVKNRSAEGVAA